jgi:hypothetical protein
MREAEWTVELFCRNQDYIRALREPPPPSAGVALTPGSPMRIPGATADAFMIITAHLDSGVTGVVGSLIAAWIWQAIHKVKTKSRARVTISRLGKRVEIDVEGETEAQTAQLLLTALKDAGLGD